MSEKITLNSRESVEIANHWNERDWLVKLVERHGYNDRVYDADANPKGIFAHPFRYKSTKRSEGQLPGLYALRFFVLRAAGVTTEKCTWMFGTSPAATKYKNTNSARAPLQEIVATRKALVAHLKSST